MRPITMDIVGGVDTDNAADVAALVNLQPSYSELPIVNDSFDAQTNLNSIDVTKFGTEHNHNLGNGERLQGEVILSKNADSTNIHTIKSEDAIGSMSFSKEMHLSHESSLSDDDKVSVPEYGSAGSQQHPMFASNHTNPISGLTTESNSYLYIDNSVNHDISLNKTLLPESLEKSKKVDDNQPNKAPSKISSDTADIIVYTDSEIESYNCEKEVISTNMDSNQDDSNGFICKHTIKPAPKITFDTAIRQLTTAQWLYVVIMHLIGSIIISGGINFAIAYGMYSTSADNVRLWLFPNTLAGDLTVTIFIQCAITMFIDVALTSSDIRGGVISPFSNALGSSSTAHRQVFGEDLTNLKMIWFKRFWKTLRKVGFYRGIESWLLAFPCDVFEPSHDIINSCNCRLHLKNNESNDKNEPVNALSTNSNILKSATANSSDMDLPYEKKQTDDSSISTAQDSDENNEKDITQVSPKLIQENDKKDEVCIEVTYSSTNDDEKKNRKLKEENNAHSLNISSAQLQHVINDLEENMNSDIEYDDSGLPWCTDCGRPKDFIVPAKRIVLQERFLRLFRCLLRGAAIGAIFFIVVFFPCIGFTAAGWPAVRNGGYGEKLWGPQIFKLVSAGYLAGLTTPICTLVAFIQADNVHLRNAQIVKLEKKLKKQSTTAKINELKTLNQL